VSQTIDFQQFSEMPTSSEKVASALRTVSDKDWNYSRISLQLRPLADITSPYVLWLESFDTSTKTGRSNLARLKSEVAWGSSHSSELGILEVISLRLNRALLEHTSDEFWDNRRHCVRIIRREELEAQGIAEAFWYHVQEVRGEEFDSR
jgi:hypothetical protein